MSRGIDQVGIFDLVMVDKSVVDCFFVEEMGVKRRVKGSPREAGREAGNHKSCEEQTAPGIDHTSRYKQKEVDHANRHKHKGIVSQVQPESR